LNAIISGSINKGVPRNRVTLFAGESMTGKTYVITKILANAQKEGLVPVIFDTEGAIDSESAAKLGLDTTKVKYVPCFSIEETRNTIYNFLTKVKENGQEGKFIIAIDSLGNLENQLSLDRMTKESSSTDMGTRARAIKSLLKTCTNMSRLTKTTFLITNHTYDDPSAMYESMIKQQPGGKSVWYLSDVTVQLARKPEKDDGGKLVDSKLAVGQRNYPGVILRALTVKNRFVRQYLQGEMYLSFESGLNKYYGLLDLAVGFGIVVQNGATYALADGTKLGYYKTWRTDEDLWNTKLLPAIEAKINTEWQYGNLDEVPDELPSEEAPVAKKTKGAKLAEDVDK
jgi:RecA/RadA recombinase